jgi:hypothetical protein
MSFAEGCFEVRPCLVDKWAALPEMDVILEHVLLVEDEEGDVYQLGRTHVGRCGSGKFLEAFDFIIYDVDWLTGAVKQSFDLVLPVVQLLSGDTSIIVVEIREDVVDEGGDGAGCRVAQCM